MGFGKDGQGQIIYDSVSTDMTNLATLTAFVIGGRYDATLVEDFRLLRVDYYIGIQPAQAVTLLNGPILVGLAAGNLTATGIGQAIEAAPLDAVSIDLELSNRAVWPLEVMMINDADLGDISGLTVKGTFNPRWTFQNPHGWQWFVYNMGTGALATGSVINITAKCFGMWVA